MEIKVNLNISAQYKDIEVCINAPEKNEEVQRLENELLQKASKEMLQIIAMQDNDIFIINTSEIIEFFSEEKNNYCRTKEGISIKIITEKIKSELTQENIQIGNKKRKSSFITSGKLSTSDWRKISFGIDTLVGIIREGFSQQNGQLLLGERDVSKIKKEVLGYQEVIDSCLKRISVKGRTEYHINADISLLEDSVEIIQAARDGVILKQEKRTEIIDGNEKDIFYDTSMTPREVAKILDKYSEEADDMLIYTLSNYLGIGLGIAGTIGTLVDGKKNGQNKENATLLTVSTTAIGLIKILTRVLSPNKREEEIKLRSKRFRLEDDLLENEAISNAAEEMSVRNIKDIANKETKLKNRTDNKYGQKR